MRRLVWVFVFLFFFPSLLHATQVLPLNLNQMVATADLICNGIFVQAVSVDVPDPDTGISLPGTRYEFQKQECMKGDTEGETFSFVQFGLSRREAVKLRKLFVYEMPQFEAGKEYVVCLTREAPGTGFRSLVGLGQGKFQVTPDATGTKSLVNEFNNADLFKNVTPTKGMTTKSAPTKGPMSYDDFKTLIREHARKQ